MNNSTRVDRGSNINKKSQVGNRRLRCVSSRPLTRGMLAIYITDTTTMVHAVRHRDNSTPREMANATSKATAKTKIENDDHSRTEDCFNVH